MIFSRNFIKNDKCFPCFKLCRAYQQTLTAYYINQLFIHMKTSIFFKVIRRRRGKFARFKKAIN